MKRLLLAAQCAIARSSGFGSNPVPGYPICYNPEESLRKWWNWQTHHLEGVAPKGVGVQIPPSAPLALILLTIEGIAGAESAY